jgi:hypothetical protein
VHMYVCTSVCMYVVYVCMYVRTDRCSGVALALTVWMGFLISGKDFIESV